MAINFPKNPASGSSFTDTASGQSYIWDGVSWVSDGTVTGGSGGGGGGTIIAGVERIIAGTGVIVSPASGTGLVTVAASISGDSVSGGALQPGVYLITDPIFGGENSSSGWSDAFNHALQQTLASGSYYNGTIKRLVVPAGVFTCKKAIERTQPVKISGQGQTATKINMGTSAPVTRSVDGTTSRGQFFLQNKGSIQDVRITGTCDIGGPSSIVVAMRRYDNDGIAFGSGVVGADGQNDSADMDTAFIQVAFGANGGGGGGDTDGLIKFVGRNAFISNCSFNTNGTAIHLTFPNKPGSESAGDSCSNDSLSNPNQGGVFGWRRCMVNGCWFHLTDNAKMVVVSGKYQLNNLVLTNNQADIGGRLLTVIPQSAQGGNYNNGVGGGLNKAVINGNNCNNQTGNNQYIDFQGGGQYDAVTISGNAFGGHDDSYLVGGCPSISAVKRCKHAVKVHSSATVNGLSINGNSFANFTQASVLLEGTNNGVCITGNTILNSSIENSDAAIKADVGTTGVVVGNTLVRTISGATSSFVSASGMTASANVFVNNT